MAGVAPRVIFPVVPGVVPKVNPPAVPGIVAAVALLAPKENPVDAVEREKMKGQSHTALITSLVIDYTVDPN